MRFALHLLAALLLIEEDAGRHEDGTADDERLADGSRAAGSGRGLEQVDGRPYRFAEGFARSIRHRRIFFGTASRLIAFLSFAPKLGV